MNDGQIGCQHSNFLFLIFPIANDFVSRLVNWHTQVTHSNNNKMELHFWCENMKFYKKILSFFYFGYAHTSHVNSFILSCYTHTHTHTLILLPRSLKMFLQSKIKKIKEIYLLKSICPPLYIHIVRPPAYIFMDLVLDLERVFHSK